MSIKDRLVAAFFGDAINQQVQSSIKAAAVSVEDENIGWRLLTGNSVCQLPMMNYYWQIQVAVLKDEGYTRCVS